MGASRRITVVMPVVAGLILTGLPALAAPEPAADPVSLVVGLRTGASAEATAERLVDRTDVDVVDTADIPAAKAVTVDVPAGDVAEATTALRADPSVAYVEPDHVARIARVNVNDPYRSRQWGLDVARVPDAWTMTRGSANVVIAVVDTGVRQVPEFAGRVLPGRDFVNKDSNADDDEGHGTMTAGVLAAAANNRAGSAGICWSCKILPVKVLGRTGYGSYSAIAKGITWAADQGADIINLSLGGPDSQLLREAVTYAVAKGALVVAAAGNDGRTTRHYPAAFGNVLAVGASTRGDARYPWSNYGAAWVDIAAPGCNLAPTKERTTAWFCGTSSATPFVAGVAGLLRATSPTASAAQIRAALTSSAAGLAGNWVPSSSGRVDAAAALGKLPLGVSGVRPGALVRGTFTVRANVSAQLAGVTRVRATLDGREVAADTAAPWALRLNSAGHAGPTRLTVTAFAGATRVASLNVPVHVDNTLPRLSFPRLTSTGKVRGTVRVGVAAADASGVHRVQLLVNGRSVATDRAAPWSLYWRSGRMNGPVRLTLRAYDRAGNMRSMWRPVTVDNTAPTIRVVRAPKNGQRRVRGLAKIAVQAADRYTVTRLELIVNGRVVLRRAARSATFAVQTSRYGKRMRVQVRAYDRAGNVRYTPARTWYR